MFSSEQKDYSNSNSKNYKNFSECISYIKTLKDQCLSSNALSSYLNKLEENVRNSMSAMKISAFEDDGELTGSSAKESALNEYLLKISNFNKFNSQLLKQQQSGEKIDEERIKKMLEDFEKRTKEKKEEEDFLRESGEKCGEFRGVGSKGCDVKILRTSLKKEISHLNKEKVCRVKSRPKKQGNIASMNPLFELNEKSTRSKINREKIKSLHGSFFKEDSEEEEQVLSFNSESDESYLESENKNIVIIRKNYSSRKHNIKDKEKIVSFNKSISSLNSEIFLEENSNTFGSPLKKSTLNSLLFPED